jgi:hypothetical protein
MNVKLSKLRSLASQPIQMRSGGQTAMEPGQMPVHIVGQYHHDIRPRRIGGSQGAVPRYSNRDGEPRNNKMDLDANHGVHRYITGCL